MTPAQDIAQLGRLVAARHGWAEAKAFKVYQPGDADRAIMARCAVDLLKVFPKAPGTAALLTGAFAVQLGRHLAAPVHVVAGGLSVDGQPVSGDRPAAGAVDIAAQAGIARGEHAWVMVGAHVLDIAIFRMAYSSNCPPMLARHVHSVFGQDKGLYVDHWRRARQLGLGYTPRRVLGAEEVTTLMGGAYAVMKPEA